MKREEAEKLVKEYDATPCEDENGCCYPAARAKLIDAMCATKDEHWVCLTDAFNGEQIWFNRDQICAVYKHEGDAWTVSSVDGFRYVRETPDVILGKEKT
jgi:hypothetical protein